MPTEQERRWRAARRRTINAEVRRTTGTTRGRIRDEDRAFAESLARNANRTEDNPFGLPTNRRGNPVPNRPRTALNARIEERPEFQGVRRT